MKKEITVREFARELVSRIEKSRDISCCKEEIRELALLAEREIPERKITVNWKDH